MIVAVHSGIGRVRGGENENINALIKKACDAAYEVLQNTNCAKSAVVKAISILEDSSLTNAGYGSNLNQNGQVECDASIIDGQSGRYGCVGALQEAQNPISVAFDLMEQQKLTLPLGMVPPNFLVGDGARTFALVNGHIMRCLVSDRSKRKYRKYKKLLESSANPNPETEVEEEIVFESLKKQRVDTVGAIAIDSNGNIVAGSSSGGLILKHPGRVGSAAQIGAGCYADKFAGVTTTGSGECIAKTFLSKKFVKGLTKSRDIKKVFKEKFLKNRFIEALPDSEEILVGFIALNLDPSSRKVTLHSAAYAGEMSFGYKSSQESVVNSVSSSTGGRVSLTCISGAVTKL